MKPLALLFFALAPVPAAATFTMSVAPLQAICQEIAARPSDCQRLLSPGVSPHTYEPRPRDMKEASKAKALFYVSPLLDEWATKLPVDKRFAVLDWLPKELRLPMEHGHEHGGPHDHEEGVDPHFWLDPLAVKAIVPKLAAVFCELDAKECKTYEGNAKRFAASLDELHKELEATLAPVRGAAFLVYHPFLGYLVRRYGLKQIGAIELAPGKEPTPRYLKDMIALAKRVKARAIIVSPEVPPSAARAVAEASGVRLVVVDDLGGTTGRERYAELLRHDAKVLLESLR